MSQTALILVCRNGWQFLVQTDLNTLNEPNMKLAVELMPKS